MSDLTPEERELCDDIAERFMAAFRIEAEDDFDLAAQALLETCGQVIGASYVSHGPGALTCAVANMMAVATQVADFAWERREDDDEA